MELVRIVGRDGVGRARDMSEKDRNWAEGDAPSFRGVTGTVEIICHLGHHVLTQTEALASGWRAEAWVVKVDDPEAEALSAGSVTALSEIQAVRDAQEQARVVIELALEDQALLDES
jgi:hypothetical protein